MSAREIKSFHFGKKEGYVYRWKRQIMWRGNKTVIGEVIPDDLSEWKQKLYTMWKARFIGVFPTNDEPRPLKDDEVTQVDGYTISRNGSWYTIINHEDGSEETIQGRAAMDARLDELQALAEEE